MSTPLLLAVVAVASWTVVALSAAGAFCALNTALRQANAEPPSADLPLYVPAEWSNQL